MYPADSGLYNIDSVNHMLDNLEDLLTTDLVTLNNCPSIFHSPCPLAVGPIGNAENMESLLDTG